MEKEMEHLKLSEQNKNLVLSEINTLSNEDLNKKANLLGIPTDGINRETIEKHLMEKESENLNSMN